MQQAKGNVPEKLFVHSPNGPESCVGTYAVVHGSMPNGWPVWKKEGDSFWLYSMNNGKWGIGGEKQMKDGFNSAVAYIFADQVHRGAMPHEMQGVWKRWSPAPVSDSAILIQAE